MRVILFGGSGTIGFGVLQASLEDHRVTEIVTVGRSKMAVDHEKLRQIEHSDFQDFTPIADEFNGLDACFWCLGVSSVGIDESDYTRITVGITEAAVKVLHERSPDLAFCFVSGAGTDETEKSRTMWARVKGRAENVVRSAGFRDVALFRPGFVMPAPGFGQRIALYRYFEPILKLLNPLLRRLGGATSALEIGRAMIAVAAREPHPEFLESRDINDLAGKHESS